MTSLSERNVIFLTSDGEQVRECSKVVREHFAKCLPIEGIPFFLPGEMLLENGRNTSW